MWYIREDRRDLSDLAQACAFPDELKRARLDRLNIEHALKELSQLGDEASLKNVAKANVATILDFRPFRLEREDEELLDRFLADTSDHPVAA
jgi:hypothetical protein